MRYILNTITHIASYAGIGMILFFVCIILIIAAVIMMGRQRSINRRVVTANFNRQFVNDTGYRISDVEAGEKRRAIAHNLGIRKER